MHVIRLTHQTSTGHRIPNHEGGKGKCARLHGHTYTFEVSLSAEYLTDDFVEDFGAVKRVIDEWDHRTLLWEDDPYYVAVYDAANSDLHLDVSDEAGILLVPFVPTAERMAQYLAERFVREFVGVGFATVVVHETEKTSATFTFASGQDSLYHVFAEPSEGTSEDLLL